MKFATWQLRIREGIVGEERRTWGFGRLISGVQNKPKPSPNVVEFAIRQFGNCRSLRRSDASNCPIASDSVADHVCQQDDRTDTLGDHSPILIRVPIGASLDRVAEDFFGAADGVSWGRSSAIHRPKMRP